MMPIRARKAPGRFDGTAPGPHFGLFAPYYSSNSLRVSMIAGTS